MTGITSPVTGAAISAFTSPTYTLTVDQPLGNNQKAWFVSALGGTQPGVNVHSAGFPFQLIVTRTPAWKIATKSVLAAVGLDTSISSNEIKIQVRKGCNVNALGGKSIYLGEIRYRLPVNGADQDPASLDAMISLLCGVAAQAPNYMHDSATNGSI